MIFHEYSHVGDIMGGCETVVTLNNSEISFSPIERIILTANGNLQRIMSAYYGAPVYVHVLKSNLIANMLYEREVDLTVFDKVSGIVSTIICDYFVVFYDTSGIL